MEQKEWSFQDKSEWGDGPWQREPDKKQWLDEETGLLCLIVRNAGGALCGYVGVVKGHSWYGVGYQQCMSGMKNDEGYVETYCEHSPQHHVSVHGGLTFSDKCAPEDKEHGICHVVGDGENDDVWWFGFDCAHAFDWAPAFELRTQKLPGFHKRRWRSDDPWRPVYKTVEYVEEQVAKLAKQLKQFERRTKE